MEAKHTMVREVSVKYSKQSNPMPSPIRYPEDIVQYVKDRIEDDAREHFIAVYLNGRHRPIGDSILSIGSATCTMVHPRELYQQALLQGATDVVIAHTHPSGDPSPSDDDLSITKRLKEAGSLLGVRLLDHIIITRHGGFTSMKERGLLG